MHEITWIGSNLGITDDVGGLEATQTGEFTVINVGEENRNPKADILAPLPWFSVDKNLLDKLSTVIEEIIRDNTTPKARVIVHDVFGMERSGLVVAWTISRANGISLDDAYAKVQDKKKNIVNYSNWIKREELI
jgi:protein-tyrosine phosphatase|tara:strand:- start:2320 stop:2721 length:402 start_codon:yes stop_codon:yes gene_type:complete